jgi:hypothetical protein
VLSEDPSFRQASRSFWKIEHYKSSATPRALLENFRAQTRYTQFFEKRSLSDEKREKGPFRNPDATGTSIASIDSREFEIL